MAAIVAETNGFKEFKAPKLTSYAGYDIVHNESGTSVLSKTRISRRATGTCATTCTCRLERIQAHSRVQSVERAH
ncbi:MAG: transposase [Flavobacteriales bacterium]|nr:transposase [Flavobacteriales bacterium]